MINVVVFNGGLGNQMFQYSFFLSHKKRTRFSLYLFDIDKSLYCHNGFELFDVFDIKETFRYKICNFLKNRIKYKFSHFKHIIQQDSLKYEPTMFQSTSSFCIYEGFWQSELYFNVVKDIIFKKYRFNISKLNIKSQQLLNQIENDYFCSIHVRRGDYLNETERCTCNVDYYNRCIDYIRNYNSKIKFCFFSDDITWCKEHFPDSTSIYVDWNKNKESWQDMCLMSFCKHNIISNSSFSWWGAMLNRYTKKIVLTPKIWFQGRDNYNIIPDTWIQL